MYHLAQHRATAARPPRRRPQAFALAVLAMGAFAAAAPVASADAAAADVTVTSHFVWTATASNSSGDSTYINNYATNNRPGDILFITPNYNQGGECGCVYDHFPVGVWYNPSAAKWAIFNENGSAIPAGASFNVLVVPAANSPKVFVQTATAANSGGDSTFLDNIDTNGRPQTRVLVTPVFNPGGTGGTSNNHPVGVWYDNSSGRWAIFNEDQADMTAGASFNVMLGNKPSGGGASAIQVATTANTSANSTFISNPMTTGNPNAVVFETPNFNPNGVGGTFDWPSTGIWWSTSSGFGGGQAAIFNQDGSAMPRTAAFNLIIFQS